MCFLLPETLFFSSIFFNFSLIISLLAWLFPPLFWLFYKNTNITFAQYLSRWFCAKTMILYWFWAGREVQTLDFQIGNLTLYQLSYTRIFLWDAHICIPMFLIIFSTCQRTFLLQNAWDSDPSSTVTGWQYYHYTTHSKYITRTYKNKKPKSFWDLGCLFLPFI